MAAFSQYGEVGARGGDERRPPTQRPDRDRQLLGRAAAGRSRRGSSLGRNEVRQPRVDGGPDEAGRDPGEEGEPDDLPRRWTANGSTHEERRREARSAPTRSRLRGKPVDERPEQRAPIADRRAGSRRSRSALDPDRPSAVRSKTSTLSAITASQRARARRRASSRRAGGSSGTREARPAGGRGSAARAAVPATLRVERAPALPRPERRGEELVLVRRAHAGDPDRVRGAEAVQGAGRSRPPRAAARSSGPRVARRPPR